MSDPFEPFCYCSPTDRIGKHFAKFAFVNIGKLQFDGMVSNYANRLTPERRTFRCEFCGIKAVKLRQTAGWFTEGRKTSSSGVFHEKSFPGEVVFR